MEKELYPVYESNEFIRKIKTKASRQALNCMFYIASQIKSKDYLLDYKEKNGSYPMDVWFNLADMRSAMGITDSGTNTKDLLGCLDMLQQTLFWQNTLIPSEDGTEMWEALEPVKFLDKAYVVGSQNRIKAVISTSMIPYFYEFEQYTKTELQFLYALEGTEIYSIVLYRLCKSLQGKGIFSKSVEELKHLLSCENVKSYSNFNLFRTKVIESAIADINKNTDINVSYEAVKTKGSRSYNLLKFSVHSKLSEKAQADLEKKLSEVDKKKNDWIMQRTSELFNEWTKEQFEQNKPFPADLQAVKNGFIPIAMKEWKEEQNRQKKAIYDMFYKKK